MLEGMSEKRAASLLKRKQDINERYIKDGGGDETKDDAFVTEKRDDRKKSVCEAHKSMMQLYRR